MVVVQRGTQIVVVMDKCSLTQVWLYALILIVINWCFFFQLNCSLITITTKWKKHHLKSSDPVKEHFTNEQISDFLSVKMHFFRYCQVKGKRMKANSPEKIDFMSSFHHHSSWLEWKQESKKQSSNSITITFQFSFWIFIHTLKLISSLLWIRTY